MRNEPRGRFKDEINKLCTIAREALDARAKADDADYKFSLFLDSGKIGFGKSLSDATGIQMSLISDVRNKKRAVTHRMLEAIAKLGGSKNGNHKRAGSGPRKDRKDRRNS